MNSRARQDLPRLRLPLLTGKEPLADNGKPLGPLLIDFWRWSTSDLVDNTVRGVLAEFVVASALNIDLEGPRTSWTPYDLELSGTSIEVKSAAYVQSWHQRHFSGISFKDSSTQAYDGDTNTYASESKRQADLYILALLSHQNKLTINPLDVAQWQFFVLPTQLLNTHYQNHKTITLKILSNLGIQPVTYGQLLSAVERALAPK